MKTPNNSPTFVTGAAKCWRYAVIAAHVAARYLRRALRGGMQWREYFVFIRRALIFLYALRHNKIVRRGGRYKLQLYAPAWPTPAFFHSLEKFIRPDPGPVTVVFSMTRACSYRCPHCYQQKDKGKDLPLETLLEAARAMQDAGVAMFDVEGGEPLLRFDRLIALLEGLDERAEKWINTTGHGLTDEKLERLIEAGLFGVMVSIHAPDPADHDAFTGVPGAFDVACDALRRCGARGVVSAINCCPSGEAVLDGRAGRLIELGRDLRCDYIQVIHPKGAGGWLGRNDAAANSAAAIAKMREAHVRYNSGGRWRDYPSVSAQVFEESAELFGCTAGAVDRFYLGADGEVQPCEFLNVSFGNVRDEPFDVIFRRMREHFQTPGNDWLCCTQAECIERAVAQHGLVRTPIPWEITRQLIGDWQRGPATRLYKKLGIYQNAGKR